MKESKSIDPSLLSNPFEYSTLVLYQDGSIVSRAIIDKDVGTVTGFTFNEG